MKSIPVEAVAALRDRIRHWQDDSRGGYDQAIALVCQAGDLLDALIASAQETPDGWQSMADAAEMLWIVLANVSVGDWSKQSPEWQEAAARWRDNYFKTLSKACPPPVPDSEGVVCLCGHSSDEHGNDGRGACGATQKCRAGGCRRFIPAPPAHPTGPQED